MSTTRLLILILHTVAVSSLTFGFAPTRAQPIAEFSPLHALSISQTKAPHNFHKMPSFIANENLPRTKKDSASLPWNKSITPSRSLTYMPMLESQLRKMKAMGMEQVSIEESLVYCESKVKPARISNMCFRNDKFRKVRLTYYHLCWIIMNGEDLLTMLLSYFITIYFITLGSHDLLWCGGCCPGNYYK